MRTIKATANPPKKMKSVAAPGEAPADPVPASRRIPSMAPTVNPPSTRNYGKAPPKTPSLGNDDGMF